jgi:hypothetical protein
VEIDGLPDDVAGKLELRMHLHAPGIPDAVPTAKPPRGSGRIERWQRFPCSI